MKETTRNSFGQTIKRDTPVKITIRETGKVLEAETNHLVLPDDAHGSFRVDGLSDANTFYARDIEVEVVEPPIEQGFYLNSAGVVFKITGERDKRPSVYHLRHIGTENVSYAAPCREHEYYSSIRQGKIVRIADIKGWSVSA